MTFQGKEMAFYLSRNYLCKNQILTYGKYEVLSSNFTFLGSSGGGYGSDDGGGLSPLAALIAPLAALALLGAASLVSLNPTLLQLAVIQGKRKRRRRRWADNEENIDYQVN